MIPRFRYAASALMGSIVTLALMTGIVSHGNAVHGVGVTPFVIPEEQAIIQTVKSTKPAVVSIVASKTVTVQQQPMIFNIPQDFQNDPFFQIVPQAPRTQQRQIASGTGFIVDAHGLIVTNKHVASDPSATYEVFLSDGRSVPATIAATDPLNDIALLRITAGNLTTLALGDSDKIDVGQTVLAIGNSLGRYQNTVTRGVISGIGRNVVASDAQGANEELSNIIQTDAAINPGNSGGPLMNVRGEVIGMNTAVDLQGQSIGFAIPINIVKEVVNSVRTTGTIQRPWLGVRFVMITPEIQATVKLPVKEGAYVTSDPRTSEPAVLENSPAFRAGLREGDIIISVDGEKMTSVLSLQKVIARHKVGDEIKLIVRRGTKTLNVSVKLGEAPNQ